MKRILIPALIALGLTIAACGASEQTADKAPATSSATTTVTPPTNDPGDITDHSSVTPTPEPTTEKPTAPAMTKAQEQAVGKAQDYLDMTYFSRSDLIDQLKFEGFSTKVATFAVDHITVNWNKQAASKAQDYLDMTHFSRSGLIDQLEFEGFTHSQAVYGVNAVGL